MKPHRSRTWAPRGQTPVVPVRGASRGRISLAALACYKPGQTSRQFYRPRVQSHLKGAHQGFTWKDYRDLVVRAHLQLGGPIVLIWDNLNVHRSAGMRQYAADHDWLTVIQLPSYAPQLNPVEGIWSLLRRSCTANVCSSGTVVTSWSRQSDVVCAESSSTPTSSTDAYGAPDSVPCRQRVKLWFSAAGLKIDGRPVTSHSLRAGGATDLGMNGATEEELEGAGRWKKGSPIPRKVYVRPAKDAQHDPFSKIPLCGQSTSAEGQQPATG
ncbi:transposase [Streptomyces maoxianensis]|uniref:Transposase n=1 Tax=Streptomyces maoxianensis TaxID=1459942 RepID=A0ABV9GD96_9ACTN